MTKIITKTAEQKTNEWIKLHNAIKVHEELIPITGYKVTVKETYASTGGDTGYDFDILVVKYKREKHIDKWGDTIFDTATLYTFKGMDIDKHLVPYEPETYAFYAWIERTQNHVDAEAFHHWVGNNEFDRYFFDLYVDYLNDGGVNGLFKFTEQSVEPDYKELTLADKLKEEFSRNKLNRGAFLECVEKMFKEETCGKGAYLRRSHSSFYKQGFSWGGIRTINDPITLYVNANCCREARALLKDEGFALTNMAGHPDVWHIHLC